MNSAGSSPWLTMPPPSPPSSPSTAPTKGLPAQASTETTSPSLTATAIAVDPKLANDPSNILSKSGTSLLTPPITPEKADTKDCRTCNAGIHTTDGSCDLDDAGVSQQSRALPVVDIIAQQEFANGLPQQPQEYGNHYRLEEVLGFGAWSKVYRATEVPSIRVSLIEELSFSKGTDSSTPSPDEGQDDISRILAVKVPNGRHAHKILEREARILTYLHSRDMAAAYLVPFYGYHLPVCSIVMGAIPNSLESYARAASHSKGSRTPFCDPIIGAHAWFTLAKQLINGLEFLQSMGCVHGDIKPANILLRTDTHTGAVTPLYCDFTSARLISPGDANTDVEEVSAVTADYTSPELFTALRDGRGGAVATPASDVFALGVTLLFAALGESPYASASSEIQKLVMARVGTPLDFARSGSQAGRVMSGSLAARIVAPAIKKEVKERIDIELWMALATDAFIEKES